MIAWNLHPYRHHPSPPPPRRLPLSHVPAPLPVWQVGFKRELIKEVKTFVVDAQMFRKDWEANGPMVPGLDPMDAVDRLRKYQQMFEVGTGRAGGGGGRGGT